MSKMKEEKRARQLKAHRHGVSIDDSALDNDPWLSCQTDVNKLVKPQLPIEKVQVQTSNFVDVSSLCPEETVLPEDTSDDVDIKDILLTVPNIKEEEEFISEDIFIEANLVPDDNHNTRNSTELSDEWVIKKTLCRCCHAEGAFSSLQDTAPGEDSTYDQMLRICFNLHLYPVPSAMRAALCAVCALCAARLRDAQAFERQVRACEARFQNLYLQNCVKVASIINIQIKEEDPAANDDSDHWMDMDEGPSHLVLVDQKVTKKLKNTPIETKNTRAKVKNTPPKVKDTPAKKRKETAPKKQPVKRVVHEEPIEMEPEQNADKNTPTDIKNTLMENKTQTDGKNTSTDGKNTPTDGKNTPTDGKNTPTDINNTAAGGEETTSEGTSALRLALQSAPRKKKTLAPHILYTKAEDSFKCSRCGELCKTRRKALEHYRRVHLKLLKYKCTHCTKSFETCALLKIHKLEEHNIDERLKCNACDKIFYKKELLKLHMNAYHMMGERVKCPMCDYETCNKMTMYKHKVKHTTTKNFHCTYCKKSYKRKSNLQLHERIHTGDKRKVCAECGQAFVQKASLNYHMAKYHPSVNF